MRQEREDDADKLLFNLTKDPINSSNQAERLCGMALRRLNVEGTPDGNDHPSYGWIEFLIYNLRIFVKQT